MKRRHFITLLSSFSMVLPCQGRAQISKMSPIVGVLWHAANEEEEAAFIAPLRAGLAEFGYIEGKNLVLENRYPAEQPERFDSYAAELASLKLDVLVAISIPSALAAQRATSTIPIVFCPIPDPVGLKLVDSLARPGANITGVSSMAFDLAAKRVQLLKEAIPGLSRVALLLNPNSPYDVHRTMAESQPAAEKLQLTLEAVSARTPEEIDQAFAIIKKKWDERRDSFSKSIIFQ